MADFIIATLRGGQNSYDPPTSLADDQVVEATNVEFYGAQVAARRLGCVQINLAGSPLAGMARVPFLHRHTPTQVESEAEFWAFGVAVGDASGLFARKTTAWSLPSGGDVLTLANGGQYLIRGLSAHQKLFLAYPSNVDRLHVWDGTSIRRVGFAAPTQPLVVTPGAAGAVMSGTRYYRYRFVSLNGTTVTRRSEMSPVTTFPIPVSLELVFVNPPVAHLGEGETHWEVELSVDNANFYRPLVGGRLPIGTGYTDTQPYANGYAQIGALSAQSGDYTPPHSAKLLALDENRILMAGSHANEALASRVSWTVVFGDPTGVSNDERIPIASVNYADLDAGEGGGVVAMSGPVNGAVWVFKRNAVYKGVRTGIRTRAYDFIAISKSRGALPGSLIEAVDQYGGPALFFLDPDDGPCRITRTQGIHRCGRDIYDVWPRLNLDQAAVVARGEFDSVRQQVHWWIAVDGASAPNLHLVVQTNEMEDGRDGARRGWAIWDGPSATGVLATCMFASNIDANVARNNDLRMCIAGEMPGRVWMTGIGATDNGTPYVARIRTKPYVHGNALHHFAVENALVIADPTPGAALRFSIERDFGLETTKFVDVSLAPVGAERQVIRHMDNLAGSELRVMQVTFTDVAAITQFTPGDGRWVVNQIALKEKKGQTS